MLFATFDYFLFLPLVAAVHWLLARRGWRTAWLLVTSLVFYAAWSPLDTAILLGVIAAAYGLGWGVSKIPAGPRRTAALSFGVGLMLSPMFFFKYLAFAAANLHAIWPMVPEFPRQHLPIGISFYTFQAIAYAIDVARGKLPPERDPVRFTTFLLFFPHLVAGPILRASTLLGQLNSDRTLTRADVGEGVARLVTGLIKKVLIADVLKIAMVDSVFDDPDAFTSVEVMIALYAYSLVIYCDFSGYSDFAIGSARLLGFQIPENFARPYQATSVAEYWRRWHITLSDWVRDYIYHPLGGSRSHPYRNTFATLLILGVWHGANWTFIVYGLLHGAAVSLNRWWRKSGPGAAAKEAPSGFGVVWRFLLTFHFVVIARVLFRAEDLSHAWMVTHRLLEGVGGMPRFALQAWAVLAAGYALHFTPASWTLQARARFAALPAPLQGALVAGAGWLCVAYGPGDALAFIYNSF